jgi:hypothetical protein
MYYATIHEVLFSTMISSFQAWRKKEPFSCKHKNTILFRETTTFDTRLRGQQGMLALFFFYLRETTLL